MVGLVHGGGAKVGRFGGAGFGVKCACFGGGNYVAPSFPAAC